MAQLVNSGISSSLVRPNVVGSAADLPFRDTALLNALRERGRVSQSGGSSPIVWNLITAANTATEVYVEAQALPVAGRQTYAQASLAVFYTRAVAGHSGHVNDQVRNRGTYEDVLAIEIQKATADMFDLVEQTLWNATQDQGLASIIDSSGTYAGINSATTTIWASRETAVGGAHSITMLEDLYEDLINSTSGSVARGARPSIIFTAPNQVTNHVRTTGASATTSLIRFVPPSMSGQKFDMGNMVTPQGGVSWNGIPIVATPRTTTTELYMMELEDIELVVHRDVTVEKMGKTNDDETTVVSFACALKVTSRNKHGKLTGVTA